MWSLPLWSATVPSPRSSCSKEASCSCPGFAPPSNTPSGPSENRRKAREGRCSIPSRPRTRAFWRKAPPRPSPARPPSGTRRARRQARIFFSAMAQPPYQPPHRRVAHGLARHTLQVASPFRGTRRRALGEVRRKQPPYGVVALRRSARRLPRSQRDPIALHPGEALHRGEAHPEEVGGLALGHGALLEGIDYLASEIFRVGFHVCMISCGSRFLLTAVSPP